jgi:hypothetical protein
VECRDRTQRRRRGLPIPWAVQPVPVTAHRNLSHGRPSRDRPTLYEEPLSTSTPRPQPSQM